MIHRRHSGKALIALLAVLFMCGAASANPFGSPAPSRGNNAPPAAGSGLPPGFAAAALPAAPDAAVRSPGMQLPADEGAVAAGTPQANNPFAPPPASIPKTADQVEADIRSQAFGAAITGLLPMKPPEIRKLLERFDETRQAVETPVYPYPEPEVVAETISLDPGAAPLEIKVATGHVTTLTLLDITGEPWPIQDISWAGNFEVINPEEGGNVIRITPMSEFAFGNLSIRMLKLKTPITFVLRTHRDKVQYRLDARIPEYGPFAAAPLIEGGLTLAAGDSVQNAILDGIPPAGALKLMVTGADSRTTAYKVRDATYVRTPLTLLSPGWTSSVSSADGMSVYTVANAPVVLLSDKGSVFQAHLSEREPAAGRDKNTISLTDKIDATLARDESASAGGKTQ